MSLARAMSRGRFLKARFGVNGSQKASRSFGMSARAAAVGLTGVVMGTPWRLRRLNAPDEGQAPFTLASPGPLHNERERGRSEPSSFLNIGGQFLEVDGRRYELGPGDAYVFD